MRSCRVVRASDFQCQSRNSPGFNPRIRRQCGIWAAVDEEVVLNKVHTKSPQKYPCYKNNSMLPQDVHQRPKRTYGRLRPMWRLSIRETFKCSIWLYVYHVHLLWRRKKTTSLWTSLFLFASMPFVSTHVNKNPCWHAPLCVVHALWEQHTQGILISGFGSMQTAVGGKLAFPDMISFRGGWIWMPLGPGVCVQCGGGVYMATEGKLFF